MHIQYAIVFVNDMPKATAFYRDVLGLPLKLESPAWIEFATEGSTLALHLADVSALPTQPGVSTGRVGVLPV